MSLTQTTCLSISFTVKLTLCTSGLLALSWTHFAQYNFCMFRWPPLRGLDWRISLGDIRPTGDDNCCGCHREWVRWESRKQGKKPEKQWNWQCLNSFQQSPVVLLHNLKSPLPESRNIQYLSTSESQTWILCWLRRSHKIPPPTHPSTRLYELFLFLNKPPTSEFSCILWPLYRWS